MKLGIRASPEHFVVREVLSRELGYAGGHAVYRITKRLLTTMEVQERLAVQLNVPPRSISFPALKDKGALATQFFSLPGKGPDQITGEGYTAHFEGRSHRPLAPRDLAGNWFTVTVPEVRREEAELLVAHLSVLEEQGMPNYFDEQRFGSYTLIGTFVAKAIVQGDAESALRVYLTQPARRDSADIKRLKGAAGAHWGEWDFLLGQAPRSNHRSILSFLKDHPKDFKKAINLITPALLPLLLAAYQSFLWNRIASRLITKAAEDHSLAVTNIVIAGERLAVCHTLPAEVLTKLKTTTVPLPEYRAQYDEPLAAAVTSMVLKEEGLSLSQMRARLLKRAYLTRGSRPLLAPIQKSEGQWEDGAREGPALVLRFFLPPGSYATLVLKVLEATV